MSWGTRRINRREKESREKDQNNGSARYLEVRRALGSPGSWRRVNTGASDPEWLWEDCHRMCLSITCSSLLTQGLPSWGESVLREGLGLGQGKME